MSRAERKAAREAAQKQKEKDVVVVSVELKRADYLRIVTSHNRVRGSMACTDPKDDQFDFSAGAETKQAADQHEQNKTQYARTTVYQNGDVRFSIKVPKKKIDDVENIIDEEVDKALEFLTQALPKGEGC